MARRAVVYVRVSGAEQDVDMQEAECRAHCAAHDYDVVTVVRETATGVESYDWRPGMQQVRDLLYSGQADVLLVWKFDRANRESVANLRMWQLAHDTHTVLDSVHDGTIGDDETGRFRLFMLGEHAHSERNAIVLRTQTGLRQRVVAEGMPLIGNFPLYGYRYTYGPGKRFGTQRKTGYEFEPATAPIVRRIFDSVAAGCGLGKLARELTQEGVPTPTQYLQRQGLMKPGAKVAPIWTRQTLSTILRNPAYSGHHVQWRRKYTKEDKHDGSKPGRKIALRAEGDPQAVVLSIPAIVDEELWQRCQGILAAHKAESARRNRDPESTLLRAGFAVCGVCGAPMRADNSNHIRTYSCLQRRRAVDDVDNSCPGGSFKVAAAEVDADIWRKVAEIAKDTPRLERLVSSRRNKALERLETLEREEAALERQIAECQAELDTLKERLGKVDDTVFPLVTERIGKVTAMLSGLEKQRKVVSMRGGTYTVTIAEIAETTRRLIEAGLVPSGDPLANATYAEKREILRMLGVRVKMYPTRSDYAKEHNGERWELTFDPEEVDSVGVHSETLRAYSADEMGTVLKKM